MSTPQFCKVLDGNGGSKNIRLSDVKPRLKSPVWIHIDYEDEDNLPWLKSLKLDETVFENLIDADTTPRCFRHKKGLLLVVRGVNPRKGEDDDMVAVRIWMTQNRLLTLSHRPVASISKVLEKLRRKKGPETLGDCLSMLLSKMTKQIEESFFAINESLDDLEERVIQGNGIRQDESLREKLSNIRYMIVGLKRYILPQRNVMGLLEKTDFAFFSESNLARFRENTRDLTAVVDGLEFAKDHSKVTQEELDSQTNINISRTMYLMSLVMLIFTPLTFVTGLLGANIGGIPFNDSPYGFAFICAILLCMVAFQFYLIKRIKWF
jgi:zinc transporter